MEYATVPKPQTGASLPFPRAWAVWAYILNAADDLAGGRAALTRGARQASRELKPVVIGEDMAQRVKPYAKRKGYLTIEDFIPETVWQEAFARGEAEALALNRRWIMRMMGEGRLIIDIEPSMSRRVLKGIPASKFYELERRLIRGYPHYRKEFLRFGKRIYGVPGLDFSGPF